MHNHAWVNWYEPEEPNMNMDFIKMRNKSFIIG